jgi:transcription-repair coupling factor (superfamily II helicase)
MPALDLRIGDVLTREALAALGYAEDDVVDGPGDCAWRDGRVDAWPALPEAEPHRIELDAEGHITAMRVFDPASQRSLRDADAITLPPAAEKLTDLASLFDLLPEATLVLEPEVADLRAQAVTEVADAFRLRLASGEGEPDAPPLLEPTALYLDAAAWKAALRGAR